MPVSMDIHGGGHRDKQLLLQVLSVSNASKANTSDCPLKSNSACTCIVLTRKEYGARSSTRLCSICPRRSGEDGPGGGASVASRRVAYVCVRRTSSAVRLLLRVNRAVARALPVLRRLSSSYCPTSVQMAVGGSTSIHTLCI